jgi:ADP-ribose pyrophosphatase
MKPWRRVEPTEVLYKGWRTVIQKHFIRNDGKKVTVETNDPEGTEAAAVIALTTDNKVIIARQFRGGPEKILDEIPGGAVDYGETPEMAVKRELAEEVAYRVGNIEYLGKIYKHAYLNMTWHYFLAIDCEPLAEGQNLDDLEEIEIKLISIKELIENARNARMTDTEAVFLAYERLKELEGESETTN